MADTYTKLSDFVNGLIDRKVRPITQSINGSFGALIAYASQAATSASSAKQSSTSAVAAATSISSLYLGYQSKDPVTTSTGQPVSIGAFYVNSTTGYYRFVMAYDANNNPVYQTPSGLPDYNQVINICTGKFLSLTQNDGNVQTVQGSVVFQKSTSFVGTNGDGKTIQVGDDCYIGDNNLTNGFSVRGVNDFNAGYIRFGNSPYSLGCNGNDNVLRYNGNQVWDAGSLNPGNYALLSGAAFYGTVGVFNGNSGGVRLQWAPAGRTGYIEFLSDTSTRVAYIGYAATNNIVTYSNDKNGGHSFLGGAVIMDSPLTVPQIAVTSNAAGTNIRIGDDCYIGDVNLTNGFSVKGVADPNAGYITFGNSGMAFGCNSNDGTLRYSGSQIWHSGNFDPSSYATLSGANFTGNIGISNSGSPALTLNSTGHVVSTLAAQSDGNVVFYRASNGGNSVAIWSANNDGNFYINVQTTLGGDLNVNSHNLNNIGVVNTVNINMSGAFLNDVSLANHNLNNVGTVNTVNINMSGAFLNDVSLGGHNLNSVGTVNTSNINMTGSFLADVSLGGHNVNNAGTINSSYINATSSGDGKAIGVGDDCYIGDGNITSGFSVRGKGNFNEGFIRFGNSPHSLGCNADDGTLRYEGNQVWDAGSLNPGDYLNRYNLGAMQSDMNANGHRIINIANAQGDGDIPSYGQVKQAISDSFNNLNNSNTSTQNGWVRLPGGIIMQWGAWSQPDSSGYQVLQFPIAFPNACFSITATNAGDPRPTNTASVAWPAVSPLDRQSFVISSATASGHFSGPGTTFYWQAIGN